MNFKDEHDHILFDINLQDTLLGPIEQADVGMYIKYLEKKKKFKKFIIFDYFLILVVNL